MHDAASATTVRSWTLCLLDFIEDFVLAVIPSVLDNSAEAVECTK